MSKKIIQLSIPKPCSENWNEMTPTEKGRFCSVCERNLIDFTQFSDDELLHFVKNNNNKICGRFTKNQLNRKLEPTTISENKIIQYSKVAGFVLPSFLAFNSNSQNNIESKTEINKTTKINEYVLEIVIKDSREPVPFHYVYVKNQLVGTTDVNGFVKISTNEVTPILDLRLDQSGYIEQEINLKNLNQTNGRYLIELEEIPQESNIVVVHKSVPSNLKLQAKIDRIHLESLYEYSFLVVDSVTNEPIPGLVINSKDGIEAISDFDGKISLKLKDSSATFQFIDNNNEYFSKEISVHSQSKTDEPILVQMKFDAVNNIGMIGYVIQKPKWWQFRRRFNYWRMSRH